MSEQRKKLAQQLEESLLVTIKDLRGLKADSIDEATAAMGSKISGMMNELKKPDWQDTLPSKIGAAFQFVHTMYKAADEIRRGDH